MKNAILLFVLLMPLVLFACINEYYHNPYGEPDLYYGEKRVFSFIPAPHQSIIVAKLKELETKLSVRYNDSLYSDYGVNLLKLWNYAEGLKVFQQLIARKPSEYQIIQNLGTAYELNGQLDSALFYIKKGLKINPNSHEGSEWVHVKILEAEIAAKKDANYLKTHLNLLGLPTKRNPNNADSLVKRNRQILYEVKHQLDERVPFSPPPNPLMSNIFYEFGKFLYHFDEKAAFDYLEIALWYGRLNKRIDEKERAVALRYLKKRGNYSHDGEVSVHKPTFMLDWNVQYKAKEFYPTADSIVSKKSENVVKELKSETAVVDKHESFSGRSKVIMLVVGILIASILGFIFGRKKRKE